jgi:hypothetical protein
MILAVMRLMFSLDVVQMPFKQHDGSDEKIGADFSLSVCALFIHQMPFSCTNLFFIPRAGLALSPCTVIIISALSVQQENSKKGKPTRRGEE